MNYVLVSYFVSFEPPVFNQIETASRHVSIRIEEMMLEEDNGHQFQANGFFFLNFPMMAEVAPRGCYKTKF